MNNISIADLYGYKDYKYLSKVLEKALEMQKVNNPEVSLVLVDDETIKDLNKNYRSIDKVTDVLSFAFEESDDIEYNDFRLLGEIYISIPQMRRQAVDYKHSEKRELSFLAVHGLLHLLGYDHMNEKDEKEMNELQEMILNASDIKREA